MANKTQNSNGSLVFGTGNEITNSIDTIPTPSSFGGSVSETADSFRDAVSTGSNGGAVLAIGGGNKADYALNSQLVGVQNEIKSTKTETWGSGHQTVEYNMVNGYQNSVIDGSNDTVIGVKNDVTGDGNIVLGNNRTVGEQPTFNDKMKTYSGGEAANNNIIIGSSDTGWSSKTYDHKASDTVVIGHNAIALTDDSVAIGSGSVAGKAYGEDGNSVESLSKYAGNPIGTVSVGNKGNERTVTNLAAGRINEDSTDAVNGSQLFKTNEQVDSLGTKVDTGWTAKDSEGRKIQVTPKDGENTLNFAGDENISVTANGYTDTINVGLKPVVKLDGNKHDGDGIVLDGQRGAIYATNVNMLGVKHTVALDEIGATFVRDGLEAPSATNINGGTITTDTVQGLDNTRWTKGIARAASNKWSLAASKAATQGQLSDVDFKVNKNTYDIKENAEDISALQGQVDNANKGWTAEDSDGNTTTVAPGKTLNFNGDKNIDVTVDEDNGAINVKLDPVVKLGTEGKRDGDYVVLDGKRGSIYAANTKHGVTHAVAFNENGATFVRDGWKKDSFTNINGGIVTTDTVQGLNNTTWDASKVDVDRAATEGQLKDVYTEATKHTTVELADGEENLTLGEKNTDNGKVYTLGLDDDLNVTSVTAGNTKLDNDGLKIGTTTYVSEDGLNAGGKVISDVKAGVSGKDAVNVSQLREVEATANKGWTAKVGNKDIDVKPGDTLQFKGDDNIIVSATTDRSGENGAINVKLNPVVRLDNNHNDNKVVLDGYAGTISAVNTGKNIWGNKTTTNTFNFDNGGKFVTEKVEDNRNWWGIGTVTTATNTSQFDENGAKFTKKEEISKTTWWDGTNTETNSSSTNIDGGTITISSDARGKDKVVIDGTAGEMSGLSNITWDANKVDEYATSDKAATEAQLYTVNSKVDKGWTAKANGEGIDVTPTNNTLNFAGDDNITVTATKDNNTINVKLDDDITLGNGENAININGTNGTLNIGSKFAVDEYGNVSSTGNISSKGDVIAYADDGKYSLSEVSKYAVRYNKNDDGTVNTGKITLDGPNGTTIENVAAGVNGTDAVNVNQLKAVEATASAGWTAKAGDNDGEIKVTPGSTLNFEGDGNILVNATSESNELKFGLNDTIILGDTANNSLTLSSDGSYVPPTVKTDSDKKFVSDHGDGFVLYYAKPTEDTEVPTQGVFAVTADGMVHANDVISYTNNPDSNSKDKIVKYSLNDIGDIVTQIAHVTFTEDQGDDFTNMEYTLISDFSDAEDKDKPFEADGSNTRTIGLAVRQDGAVAVGAIVDTDGKVTESGIRINDTNANTGGGGKDTITGLSNTEWKPPTSAQSMISLYDTDTDDAANKAKIEASKAATQGQLNAMYNYTVSYAVDSDGNPNHDIVNLAGTEYDKTTHENGTLVTNVAYAVTDTTSTKYEGSAAVNVDLLKDTIAGVEAGTSADIGNLDYDSVTSKDPIKSNEDNVTTAIGKLDNRVGDLNYTNVTDTTPIANGDSVTTAIGKLDNRIDTIKGTATSADNDTITGGKIDATNGTISLTQKDKGTINLEGKLTDSEVTGVSLEKDATTGKNTLKITSTDKYSKETSSVSVSGLEIASTDDIKDVAGATSSDELKEKYKDTAYLKDENGETVGSLADADIALDRTVQNIAYNVDNRLSNIENRLGDVEERIDKVGAMAAAIANLRTMGYDPEAPTEVAVGIGQYKSETGLALGIFHYPNQDFMLSASISTSGDEVMGGIGATWRIGRKSAEEKAKDEEERILAKAEEIKQAAKRAEVKAQADRHAKLLAEREAAGEPIRPVAEKPEQPQEQTDTQTQEQA